MFQGQYYDPETNLAYNRFRYYSPDTGGYISQDPIRLSGGNPNFYAYVKDVNRWIDPFGLTGELVYQLIGKNGVNYFGITSRDALTRMNEHIADGKIFSRYWWVYFAGPDWAMGTEPKYVCLRL
ncbi:RHS repeat-associated core domain-containing protein [Flavivirga aquatica]|uniref:RHS repeat-associated core domain-containing protein n=1 Tax=Flavivirga aquatica TaxID=1849968 RepID=UPI0009F32B53|nr:RHS repeat-associated core domain-containing protein [Flavivirga aquatica]